MHRLLFMLEYLTEIFSMEIHIQLTFFKEIKCSSLSKRILNTPFSKIITSQN